MSRVQRKVTAILLYRHKQSYYQIPNRMKKFIFPSILAVLLFSACDQPPTATETVTLPTPAAVADVPTLPPPVETVVKSVEIEPEPTAPPAESNVEPVEEDEPEPEDEAAVEAAEPEPTVDLSINPDVNIISTGDKEGQAGELLVMAGRAARRSNQRLVASLVSLDGRELVAQEIEELDFGAWETSLPLPSTFSGQARFTISILNDDDSVFVSDSELVNIGADTDADRYLQLDKPGPGGTGTAGNYLFFDGFAERPIDFKISIAVRTDDCRTQVSRQSFPMNGSGNWRGFVQIPEDVTGTACAIAWFGEEGSADRREAQYLINVASKDEGAGTLIGWPRDGETVQAGQTVFFQGVSWNAVDDQLSIQIRLADGSVAAGDVVTVQQFGYWEAELLLPVDLEGEVQVSADGGNGADTILLNVEN